MTPGPASFLAPRSHWPFWQVPSRPALGRARLGSQQQSRWGNMCKDPTIHLPIKHASVWWEMPEWYINHFFQLASCVIKHGLLEHHPYTSMVSACRVEPPSSAQFAAGPIGKVVHRLTCFYRRHSIDQSIWDVTWYVCLESNILHNRQNLVIQILSEKVRN